MTCYLVKPHITLLLFCSTMMLVGGHTLLVGELEYWDNSPTSRAVRPKNRHRERRVARPGRETYCHSSHRDWTEWWWKVGGGGGGEGSSWCRSETLTLRNWTQPGLFKPSSPGCGQLGSLSWLRQTVSLQLLLIQIWRRNFKTLAFMLQPP